MLQPHTFTSVPTLQLQITFSNAISSVDATVPSKSPARGVISLFLAYFIALAIYSLLQLKHTSADTSTTTELCCQNPAVTLLATNAGQLLHCSFELQNCGASTIAISSVSTSCSCTVAAAHPTTVKPGGTFSLPVDVTAGHVDGTFLRHVYVHYRHADDRTIARMLRLDATVVVPDPTDPDKE